MVWIWFIGLILTVVSPFSCVHYLSVVMVICTIMVCVFFFFKQKTAYEMRISDWSSDVCSSDLSDKRGGANGARIRLEPQRGWEVNERSEERRVGKSVSVRVDLGGRRIIKKKKKQEIKDTTHTNQEDKLKRKSRHKMSNVQTIEKDTTS